MTALKLQQAQLEHRAHFDALTGLPNRLLLSDRLRQSLRHCARDSRLLATVVIDIDGFHNINALYGHCKGDQYLVAIARELESVLRQGDTLARLGGDQFGVILSGLQSVDDCTLLSGRLFAACARPFAIGGEVLTVTASVGVALYPGDGADLDQLLRHADSAMRAAKKSGKNRCIRFDAMLDADSRNRIADQSGIDQAIQNREFVLYYQPKVNMETSEVVGVEALVRWRHPQRGLLEPAAFLPQIENHVIAQRLDGWVLGEAVRQFEDWCALGLHLPVSINVGTHYLQNKDFIAAVTAMLSRSPHGGTAGVEIEIAEASVVEDLERVQKVMQECCKLGVHCSIDDFGTGHFSLTDLKKLPASTLKIDQRLVHTMLDDRADLAVVKGVIGFAAAFDLNVIAEGVETETMGAALLALGCRLGQGYAIAHPMPATAIPDWIRQWQAPASWTRPATADPQSGELKHVLALSDIRLDLMTRKVYCSDEELPLRPIEFKLFEYLMRNANQTVTRTRLLQNIWGYNFDPKTNLIDVHISKLRRKFSGKSDVRLRTVRNFGYTLTDAK